MSSKLHVFLVVFCLASIKFSCAQSPLETLVTSALEKSPEARIIELNHEQNKYSINLKSAQLKPGITLTSNLPGYTRSINSITQPDGSLKFQTQSQAFSSLGINASQNISKTGGRLSLISGLNRIDLFEPSTTTNWSSNLFIVSYSQPLFGYNEMKLVENNLQGNIKVNNAVYQKQIKQFEQKITELLFDYIYSQNQLTNIRLYLIQQDKIIKKTKQLVFAGKILQEDLDLLLIEQTRTKFRLDNFKSNTLLLDDQLNFHFGDTSYKKQLEAIKLMDWQPSIPSKSSLEQLAQSDPSWISRLQQVELSKQDVQRQKQNGGLSASVEASFGYNQRAGDLQGIYQNPLDRQMGSISISVPILDGGRAKYSQLIAKNNLEQSKLSKVIAEQNVQQKIDALLIKFHQLDQEIKLLKESRDAANSRALTYIILFEAGRISVDQYLEATHYVNNLELELLSAQINYWKLYYSYWF